MRSGKHYKKLTLSDGKKRDEHRVVMEQKLGRKLEFNEIVHHDDEDINNNSTDNLKIMTRSEHGRLHAATRVYGQEFSDKMRKIAIENMTHNKLTPEDVVKIRSAYQIGFSAIEIQNDFNISKRTVYDIVSRNTWKHI